MLEFVEGVLRHRCQVDIEDNHVNVGGRQVETCLEGPEDLNLSRRENMLDYTLDPERGNLVKVV